MKDCWLMKKANRVSVRDGYCSTWQRRSSSTNKTIGYFIDIGKSLPEGSKTTHIKTKGESSRKEYLLMKCESLDLLKNDINEGKEAADDSLDDGPSNKTC